MQTLYKKPELKNTKSSYYFELSHQFHSNSNPSFLNSQIHSPPPQQQFTFSKDFYTTKYKKSAITNQNLCLSKYRSASLPSQCLVRNPSRNHFSYYDQLRNRSYIVGKKYRTMSELKRESQSLRGRSYNNLEKPNLYSHNQRNHLYPNPSAVTTYNTQLNRFSKYNPQSSKKLSKSTLINKEPIIKTNIKLYEKPDHLNRFTQIHSKLEPHGQFQHNGALISQQNQQPNGRCEEVPVVNCNIEVKSDDQGRYYSTVQSQFPAIINGHKIYHDPEEKLITTEAFIVRDFANPFQNVYFPQEVNKVNTILPSKNSIQLFHTEKAIQTQNKMQPQQYGTYILRKNTSPLDSQEMNFGSPLQTKNNHHQSIEQKNPIENSTLQIPQSGQKIKRKIIIEYQIDSPKNQPKSPTKPNHKTKSTTKNHAQNLGLKYYYSKYYLAEQENRQKNRSKSSSIRKSQKSENKQKTKRSSSRYNTNQKSSKRLISAQSPKTKEKVMKPSPANYMSTHLLTAKK